MVVQAWPAPILIALDGVGLMKIIRTYSLVLLGIAACQDATEPGPGSSIPDVRAFVTGDALAALDDQGHFRPPIPHPRIPPSICTRAVTAALARRLIS